MYSALTKEHTPFSLLEGKRKEFSLFDSNWILDPTPSLGTDCTKGRVVPLIPLCWEKYRNCNCDWHLKEQHRQLEHETFSKAMLIMHQKNIPSASVAADVIEADQEEIS
eukprot:scaffold63911_cov67-Cyclotella_meneghiniana.AAC.7